MPILRPEFRCAWRDAVFLHFVVDDAERLERLVRPLSLDRFDGAACVSLVAFHMHGFRARPGHGWPGWLTAPIASYPLLNLRAYVRDHDTSGIMFLREWIPNRAARLVGPGVYGLPYRLASLDYHHGDRVKGAVVDRTGARLVYAGRHPNSSERSVPDACSTFFLERYVAWTRRRGRWRRFQVEHDPWPCGTLSVEMHESTLLEAIGWWGTPRLIAAHYSAGVDVSRITWPDRTQFAIA